MPELFAALPEPWTALVRPENPELPVPSSELRMQTKRQCRRVRELTLWFFPARTASYSIFPSSFAVISASSAGLAKQSLESSCQFIYGFDLPRVEVLVKVALTYITASFRHTVA